MTHDDAVQRWIASVDGTQHLFRRRASDFGQIVDEVLALAS